MKTPILTDSLRDKLQLGIGGAIEPRTWFLGPKAENHEMFCRLIGKALKSHVAARLEYAPDDPPFLKPTERQAEPFVRGEEFLDSQLDHLLDALKGSLPLASYRNQSHMYWDLTLPSTIGYFAAMLYNQNNVAAEASPVTTWLEMQVGDDICRMLGYAGPADASGADGPRPWGHITCDGSVANAEAVWAARNLKYLPIAAFHAIAHEPILAAARDVTVRGADGRRAYLMDLDSWQLLNLPIDETIGLTGRIMDSAGLAPEALDAALQPYGVQALGLVDFHQRFLTDRASGTPVIFAPATAHYSWPKSAALLGLGSAALRLVPVDIDGRMDIRALRRMLDQCLRDRRAVLQVVAVMGSTAESAVDPLADILDLRAEYREMGMEFAVHADAAWGGYFASMLREPRVEVQDSLVAPHVIDRKPDIQLSDHVRRQLGALPGADTITLDPHKSGFCPYPAGGLCYRNGAMRDVVTFTAPVVYHGGIDPTVGVYGIEGSKPGAAAAGVYLSHKIIPADRSGYGRLLGRCIFNNKRFHAALLSLPSPRDDFTVTTLQRLPSEKSGATPTEVAEEIDFIRREIAELENDALIAKIGEDDRVRELFKALGADLSILSYAFNFRTAAGLNTDLALMNELNERIYQKLSVSRHYDKVPDNEMFVTAAEFAPQSYGQPFVDGFAKRAGVSAGSGNNVKFLISTTQNPWLSDTSKGSFIPDLMQILRRTVRNAAQAVIRRHGLDPVQP